MDNYLYVWIRKDLPEVQRIIQASHACFEHGLHKELKHPYIPSNIVLFQVENEKELIEVHRDVQKKHLGNTTIFYEPDPMFGSDNPKSTGYTAIAAGPFKGKNEDFAGYNLYRSHNTKKNFLQKLRKHIFG